jgi:hypothetical protein
MKCARSSAFLACLLILCVPLSAQTGNRKVGFLINLGFMTREGLSPQWMTLGPELVLPLGPRFSINPEVTLWGSGFTFRSYYVVPGALINLRVGRWTIGAGPVKRFWISRYMDDDSSESIVLQFQVGYRSRNSRIALVAVPISRRNYVSFGLVLGMGF